MPLVWFAHIGLSYLVVGLHCHQELLEGDLFGMAGVRLVQLLITLGAGSALVVCGLRVWRPLHASGDEAERNRALAAGLLRLTMRTRSSSLRGPASSLGTRARQADYRGHAGSAGAGALRFAGSAAVWGCSVPSVLRAVLDPEGM
jgi:hypothetical protein